MVLRVSRSTGAAARGATAGFLSPMVACLGMRALPVGTENATQVGWTPRQDAGRSRVENDYYRNQTRALGAYLTSLGRAFMVRNSVDQRDRRRGSDRARGTLCRCLLTEAAGVLTGCWARLPALAAAPIPPPAASQTHNAAPISPPSVGKTTRPAFLCSQRDMAHGLPTPRTTLRTGYVRVLVWVQVLPPSARCRSASPGRRRQGRRAAGPSDDASGHADPGVAGTNCGLGDGGWPAAVNASLILA